MNSRKTAQPAPRKLSVNELSHASGCIEMFIEADMRPVLIVFYG